MTDLEPSKLEDRFRLSNLEHPCDSRSSDWRLTAYTQATGLTDSRMPVSGAEQMKSNLKAVCNPNV